VADEWIQPEPAFRMAGEADGLGEEELEVRSFLLRRPQAIGPYLHRLADMTGSGLHAVLGGVLRLGRGLWKAGGFALEFRTLRQALAVLLIAGAAAGGIWLAVDALELFDRSAARPADIQPSTPAAAGATEPYTLQVAAYLRQEYALKLVEDLKRKGLDAYWTETSSAGKLWYQVRIARFPDQQSAREFGRNLKWKGLIDDFYVTQYVR
jgi:hypothetical protein